MPRRPPDSRIRSSLGEVPHRDPHRQRPPADRREPRLGEEPPELGPDTPKICLGGVRTDEANMRLMKQIGVDYVLGGGPRGPWTEESLRELMLRYKAGGLTVINLMIGSMGDIIHGGPNRDAQIEYFIQSIRAAGKVGA